MNLVPQNINEAIKHLKPRSQEEIDDMLKKMSTSSLIDFWQNAVEYYNDEDAKIYNMILKRANLGNIKAKIIIKSIHNGKDEWPRKMRDAGYIFDNNKLEIINIVNESIKHLSPRSPEEMHDLVSQQPLSQQITFAKEHNIKLTQEEYKDIINKIKDEIPRINKFVRREALKLRKKYGYHLFLPEDSWYDIISSSYYTFGRTAQLSIKIDPKDAGMLSPIFKEIDLTYYFIIFPEQGFSIDLHYEWEHPTGSNGYRLIYQYDENGKFKRIVQ